MSYIFQNPEEVATVLLNWHDSKCSAIYDVGYALSQGWMIDNELMENCKQELHEVLNAVNNDGNYMTTDKHELLSLLRVFEVKIYPRLGKKSPYLKSILNNIESVSIDGANTKPDKVAKEVLLRLLDKTEWQPDVNTTDYGYFTDDWIILIKSEEPVREYIVYGFVDQMIYRLTFEV